MDPSRKALLEHADALLPEARRLLREITGFAEVALAERKTSALLCDFLGENGFEVKRGVGGMETAFVAESRFGTGRRERPAVAFLCEMDALPELGHACGHNIVGVASACAAVALAAFGKGRYAAGKVVAVGTPAEETGFGKPKLIEAGAFKGVDAAMMVHPSSRRHVAKGYLALHRLRFTFHGKAAHAAAYPEAGVNALDGVLLLFNGINALRQHLPDTVRVHGIVTDGGVAPNIVPERAEAYFYVRGEDDAELLDAVERVRACADAAAVATGCRLTVTEGPYTLSAMRVNPVLAASYRRALDDLGLAESQASPSKNRGSSDIGNVSRVVPTIQPNVPIAGEGKVEIHTRGFEKATAGKGGVAGMAEGIRAMALCANDIFADPALVKASWAAHRAPTPRP